jgi:hypothetical protein
MKCRSTKSEFLKPIHLSREAWYYEERRGILVVQEARTKDGELLKTAMVTIPWSKLERALEQRKGR